jgi:Na+/proline symporter
VSHALVEVWLVDLGSPEFIAAAVLLFLVVGILVFLERKQMRLGKKRFDTSTVFLMIGVLWIIAGLFIGTFDQEFFFENGLFNLGLVVLIAGVIAFAIERLVEK